VEFNILSRKISSVSPTANPDDAASQNPPGQFVNDFNAIGTAMQSGSLSTAKSALSTFQQDLPSSIHPPFGDNSQANADYQRMVNDLQSGDLSGAQKALASLKNDIQEFGAAKTHIAHPHQSSIRTTSSATSANSTAATSVVASDSENDGSILNATA
jgi:hypothetical protein